MLQVERSGPWEAAPPIVEELLKKPCPPCQVPTAVTCPGQHEVSNSNSILHITPHHPHIPHQVDCLYHLRPYVSGLVISN